MGLQAQPCTSGVSLPCEACNVLLGTYCYFHPCWNNYWECIHSYSEFTQILNG